MAINRDKLPLMQKGKHDLICELRAEISENDNMTRNDILILLERKLLKIELKYQPPKQ